MKNFLSIIAVLVLSSGTLFGNTILDTTYAKKKKKANDQCVISTKNEILKEIINFEEIKNHFGISTRRQNDIKVFANAYFDQTTDVSINFEKVMIVDNPSRYPDALIIDFSKIDCSAGSAEFSISSRTKDIQIRAGLRDNNGKWEIQVLSHEKL